MEIDHEARHLAVKILIVVFIIMTIVVNAEYLLRYLRVPKIFYRPGHFGKITLSLGSILLAIFPYVVWAREAFEGIFFDVHCRTIMTAITYQYSFFPFVFGFIIVSTGLNLFLSQRQSWTFNMMSFLMAAIPWLLALLIICPLAFAGMDWEHGCYQETFLDRARALHVVGVLIPAIAALLFSIVLNVVTSTSTQQPVHTRHSALTENIPNADTTASNASPNTNLAMSNLDTTEPIVSEQTKPQPGIPGTTESPLGFHQSQQGAQQYPHQYPPQYPQQYPQQYNQQYPQQYPHQYPPQYPQQYPHQYPQQYPNQQFPQHYPPPIAQQHPQVTTMCAGSDPQTTAPAVSAHLTAQQVAMEKRGLLWASLIFFFSVLPNSCFALGYVLNDDPETRRYLGSSTTIILRDTCIWIALLYPVLVPIAWRSQVQM